MGRRNVTGGTKLALEVGQLKGRPAAVTPCPGQPRAHGGNQDDVSDILSREETRVWLSPDEISSDFGATLLVSQLLSCFPLSLAAEAF